MQEKSTVKMWDLSWFNLLYTMKVNLGMLNDSQYYTTAEEVYQGGKPTGKFKVTQKRANINIKGILDEIARQRGLSDTLDEAIRLHQKTKELAGVDGAVDGADVRATLTQ
jgi:hypothetical protein